LKWGDATALGDTGGAATVAFTAFGSGSGNPRLNVYVNYSLLGQFANRMRGGVIVRNENPLISQTALGTGVRLSLLQKQITSNVVIRTGTIQTANLTAGVTTLAALSDRQLDRTMINVDNKPVRNNQNNLVEKSYYERMWNTRHPAGYLDLSFIEGQNILLSYRGDGLQGGSTFEVDSDVISSSSNNRQFMVQEMVYGGPFPSM